MTKSPRILCIDSNEDTCLMLKTLLRMPELEAISVHNTEEALRLIEKERFSLYIIDFQLPFVSEVEFCKEIRKLDAETPILIYTAASYESDGTAGILCGANAYLVKPEVDEIVPTIKRLLQKA